MSLNNRLASSFIRLPSDSSGKRAQAVLYHEVEYANGTHTFQVGDYVRGLTSNTLAETVAVFPTDATSGYLWLIQEDGGVDTGYVQGEQLRHSSMVVADVVSATPRFVPSTIITGKNNPMWGQYVDAEGAAFFRFAEGSPLFAPFGEMKIANSKVVGVYEHSTDSYDDLYSITTGGGGSSTYLSQSSEVVMNVDTASGSYVQRTTNRYHYYIPGTGQTVLMTVACGDTGKTGNVRRWGYFDDDDGIFFELSGTTLNVVLRSSTTGAPVETRVPQNSFNVDTLDGEGLSQVVYSADKFWVYWMDLQWLGAGRVRMGVVSADGRRVTAHEFENSGQNTHLYMQQASLPLRWENINTGSPVGSSDLKEGCSAVRSDGFLDYTFWRQSDMDSGLRSIGSDPLPLLSVRSKPTINGNHNHVSAYPEDMAVYVSGTCPVKITIGEATTTALSGATWSISGLSTVEGDKAATSMSLDPADWWPEHSIYVSPGTQNYDLSAYFEINDSGINLTADGQQPPWVFLVEKLDPSGSASIRMTLSYKELF